jgi:hypothetical protein
VRKAWCAAMTKAITHFLAPQQEPSTLGCVFLPSPYNGNFFISVCPAFHIEPETSNVVSTVNVFLIISSSNPQCCRLDAVISCCTAIICTLTTWISAIIMEMKSISSEGCIAVASSYLPGPQTRFRQSISTPLSLRYSHQSMNLWSGRELTGLQKDMQNTVPLDHGDDYRTSAMPYLFQSQPACNHDICSDDQFTRF